MQAGAARPDESLTGLDELLGGSEGALALLRQAARRLERSAAEHALLARGAGGARPRGDRGERSRGPARAAAEALAFDPARLEEAEARLFDIRALARKHRVEPDALPALGEQMREQLAAHRGRRASSIAELDRAAGAARAAYAAAAAALSSQRRAPRRGSTRRSPRELAPLKLDAARFRTAIAAAEPGPSGRDRVEFEVSTNPGAPFGPLTRIAAAASCRASSSRSRSRWPRRASAATMIFDEIDRGVGGAVASAIGERLAPPRASSAQVLVVTHSPQVAARAAHHYLIEKSHDGIVTRTGVRKLDERRRREEIARMLSGASITDEARAQAARLLEAA